MAITRNARIQTLTVRDEQVTAIVMTAEAAHQLLDEWNTEHGKVGS